MTSRMRVTGWKVQPVVYRDDGETLEEVEVQGAMIPVKGWQAFKDGGDEDALEGVRQQIETAGAPEAPTAEAH